MLVIRLPEDIEHRLGLLAKKTGLTEKKIKYWFDCKPQFKPIIKLLLINFSENFFIYYCIIDIVLFGKLNNSSTFFYFNMLYLK